MAPSDSEIGRLAPSELADAQALVTEAGWNQVAASHLREYDARFGTTLVRSPAWA